MALRTNPPQMSLSNMPMWWQVCLVPIFVDKPVWWQVHLIPVCLQAWLTQVYVVTSTLNTSQRQAQLTPVLLTSLCGDKYTWLSVTSLVDTSLPDKHVVASTPDTSLLQAWLTPVLLTSLCGDKYAWLSVTSLVDTSLPDKHMWWQVHRIPVCYKPACQMWMFGSLCCRCLRQYYTACIVRLVLCRWTRITSMSPCQSLSSCVRSRVTPGTAGRFVIW